jgi:hypothetical protein
MNASPNRNSDWLGAILWDMDWIPGVELTHILKHQSKFALEWELKVSR